MFDTSEFEGWPSGDCKPLIEIKLKPDEICKIYKLCFVKEKDNLDWFEGSHFHDKVIGPVVFMKHENSQSCGTLIYVDSESDFLLAYNKLLKVLDLNINDILWKSELITETI